MPYKRGAPQRNRNAFKNGRFTRESLALRKRVYQTLRSARSALVLAKFEVAFACTTGGDTKMDKSR